MNRFKNMCGLAITGGLSMLAADTQAAVVQADVTYVDATEANTGDLASILNTAGVWQEADGSSTPPNTPRRTNGLWDVRTGFGFGGKLLEAGDQGKENAPMLTTTITGLTPGQSYAITGYYGGHATANWEIWMGLDSGSLSHFDNTNANTIVDGDVVFTGGLVLANGGLPMHWADLGSAVADINGEIKVYINDTSGEAPDSIASIERTWYDGVGYKAVPEPGSLALLSLGGLAMLRRRRD